MAAAALLPNWNALFVAGAALFWLLCPPNEKPLDAGAAALDAFPPKENPDEGAGLPEPKKLDGALVAIDPMFPKAGVAA